MYEVNKRIVTSIRTMIISNSGIVMTKMILLRVVISNSSNTEIKRARKCLISLINKLTNTDSTGGTSLKEVIAFTRETIC